MCPFIHVFALKTLLFTSFCIAKYDSMTNLCSQIICHAYVSYMILTLSYISIFQILYLFLFVFERFYIFFIVFILFCTNRHIRNFQEPSMISHHWVLNHHSLKFPLKLQYTIYFTNWISLPSFVKERESFKGILTLYQISKLQ